MSRADLTAESFRNDLVVLAVYDQGRDIDFLEILGEIGLGERLDAFI